MNVRQLIQILLVSAALVLSCVSPTQAADLGALRSLFYTHYNALYTPRFCGKNIERFLNLAETRGIDLRGSTVFRISGLSFFQTSSFFGRGAPNRRQNLGDFHYILVADDHVIDFDLHIPVVLPLAEYLRLQLTPDELISSPISGLIHPKFNARDELANLEVKKFDAYSYAHRLGNAPFWVGRMEQTQNIDEILRIDRRALSLAVLNRAR